MLLSILLGLLLFAEDGVPAGTAPAPAAPSPPAPPEALRPGFEAVDEADLRAWVGFLASEELEGRESGRRGYDVAARFCAALYERWGLKPLGAGGGYFQEFQFVRTEPDAEASSIEVRDGGGTERIGLAGNLALREARELEWSQPWTFAGLGEGADADARDRFRGIDLASRVVMVVPRPGQRRFESRGALAAGARRIAIVSDERAKSRRGLEAQERPAFDPEPAGDGSPEVVYISRSAADRILRSKGVTLAKLLERPEEMARIDLDGVEVKLTVKRRRTVLSTRNVVGLLEGSDPALRAEAVSIGAHLDHVGAHDGKVYRGADDDASGSSGVLALLKAFASSPRRPGRSVLFLLFAGEEKGLWGSRYFVDNPPFPLRSIVTHIQMDMIGRNEERPPKEKAEENGNSVHLVGSQRLSRDLHAAVLGANRLVGLDFEFDEEDVYGRSDHLHFGERGIPVAFFFTGFHPDYHQPSDTPEKINYPKLARVVRLIFAAAHDLAERPGRPYQFRRL